MDRMKTFLMYLFMLVGFFIISNILENGLIDNMYSKMTSKISNSTYINGIYSKIEIEDLGGKASNVNGYIDFKIKNNMDSEIEKCFLKIDLYNERDLLAETKYIEVDNLKPNEERTYKVKFKGNNIKRYEISLQENADNNPNIIRILGWDVDFSKLGIDPRNFFGIDLTQLSLSTLKAKGLSMWNYGINLAKSLPIWAYVVATGIIVWNLPSGYLFFL